MVEAYLIFYSDQVFMSLGKIWNHGLPFYTSLNLGHISGKSYLFFNCYFLQACFHFFFPNKSTAEGVGFPAAEFCAVSSNAASVLHAGFTASLICQHQYSPKTDNTYESTYLFFHFFADDTRGYECMSTRNYSVSF